MTCALQWWLKMDALRLYIRALEISLLTYLHVPRLHIVRKKYDNLNYTERKTTELSQSITKSLLNYNFEDICTVFQQEVAWMSLKPVTKRTQSKFLLEDTPKILSNAVLIQLQSVPEKNGTKFAASHFCKSKSQSRAVLSTMSRKKLLTQQKRTFWMQQLNILCFAVDKWTIRKQN